MSAQTIDDIRSHTTVCENDDGTVTAIYAKLDESEMATAENEEKALLAVLAKLRGDSHGDMLERPWLSLCGSCNRRAAAAGDKSEAEGRIRDETCEVCIPCATALDEWEKAHAEWVKEQKRKARNKRKQKLRLIK